MARLLITPGTRSTAPAGAAAATAPAGAESTTRAEARRSGRRWLLLLAAGWLVQAGLRAWFSRMQGMPLANPDETAYLIAARVLAGGPGADLSGSTLYQGGYPLLITPVYWFTSNPGTVYHAVMIVNAAVSATVLPLGYLICRRLGLGRPAAYGVATVAALVPAAFFYSQYAMTDAVFPVVTLAWLLVTHCWLNPSAAASPRGRYAAAAGSALLSGYAYMIHSRGLVMLAGYAAVGAFIAWRRPAARLSVVVAGLIAVVTVAAGWSMNHYLSLAIYPEGTRSLSGQLRTSLGSMHDTLHVLEMAAGQLWRLVLDSWGIAGIGLAAALGVIVRGGLGPSGSGPWGSGGIPRDGGAPGDGVSLRANTVRRGVRSDLRIMAALSVAVTTVIACTAPAALPPDQPQTWASGRYLDGMIIAFFLAGAVVLLRAGFRPVLACAVGATALFALAAVTVAVYAGSSLPTAGFGFAFNFAEPAVLTMNWTQASVLLATAVTLGLLAVWIAFAFAARWWRAAGPALAACVAAVSLVAVAQMTSHVSQAGAGNAQSAATLLRTTGLKPGDQVAAASDLNWPVWVPQLFEITWTELQFFNPASQPPPAGVTVVEVPWQAGQTAQESWPNAPAGWRIVASDQTYEWVAWRAP